MLYAKNKSTDIAILRFSKWKESMASKVLSPSATWQAIPPTSAALMENLKRAHFQVSIWRHSLDPHPPKLVPECFGWDKDSLNEVLLPVLLPKLVPFLPPALRDLVFCICKTDIPF